MPEAIYWLHDDCLGRIPEVPAIYVFDEQKLVEAQWSLKRIGFIYECLLALPVEIERGDPVTCVTQFATAREATRILTTATPDPRLQAQQKALALQFDVQVEVPEPFVKFSKPPDLRRFSKYWFPQLRS